MDDFSMIGVLLLRIAQLIASWALGNVLASKSPLHPANSITVFDVLRINTNDQNSEEPRLVVFLAVLMKSAACRMAAFPPAPCPSFYLARYLLIRPIKVKSPPSRGMKSGFPNRNWKTSLGHLEKQLFL
jgi:hypothetical protein